MYADDLTISDGVLDSIQYLVLCTGIYYSEATLDKIKAWLKNGGVLIGFNTKDVRSLENNKSYLSEFFNPQGGEKKVGNGISCIFRSSSVWMEELPESIWILWRLEGRN